MSHDGLIAQVTVLVCELLDLPLTITYRYVNLGPGFCPVPSGSAIISPPITGAASAARR